VIWLLARNSCQNPQQGQKLQQRQQRLLRGLSPLLQQLSCSEAVMLQAAQTMLRYSTGDVSHWNSMPATFLTQYVDLAQVLSYPRYRGASRQQQQQQQEEEVQLQEEQRVVEQCLQLSVSLIRAATSGLNLDTTASRSSLRFFQQAISFSGFACNRYLFLQDQHQQQQQQQQGELQTRGLPPAFAQVLQKLFVEHTASILPQLLQLTRQQLDAVLDSGASSDTGAVSFFSSSSAALQAGLTTIELAKGLSLPSLTYQQQQQQQHQQQQQAGVAIATAGAHSAAAAAARDAAAAAAAATRAAQLCCLLQDCTRTAVTIQRRVAGRSMQSQSQMVGTDWQHLDTGNHVFVDARCRLFMVSYGDLCPLVETVAATGDLSSPAALQLYGLLVSLIKEDASSDEEWSQTLHIPAGCASSAFVLITITQLMDAVTTAADSGLNQGIQALKGGTASSSRPPLLLLLVMQRLKGQQRLTQDPAVTACQLQGLMSWVDAPQQTQQQQQQQQRQLRQQHKQRSVALQPAAARVEAAASHLSCHGWCCWAAAT
jgi:hypothetical protein